MVARRVAAAFAAVLLSGVAVWAAENPEAERIALYLRVGIADQVVSDASKLAGSDALALAQVKAAAGKYHEDVVGGVRRRLLALHPDEETAQREFARAVNRFAKATSSADAASIAELGGQIGFEPAPTDAAKLREAIMARDLQDDIARGGRFLGDVQAWLRIRSRGAAVPLEAWLSRDAKTAQQPTARPKRRRRVDPLREAEAAPVEFVEAKDDGASSLRAFGVRRREQRKNAMAAAQQGMEQVSAERKVADEEANAKKLAAAQAEAAALQAHAQKLAAAEEEAIRQDENSWKTRLKGVVSAAVGAAAGAFAGGIGSRVGEAAANAILNPPSNH